jgi:creatinine amidohydrolase/Fe(II)-dependent formamide hydrolase-like protein/fructoselysine-6-P-deglycase FrlB-like protein
MTRAEGRRLIAARVAALTDALRATATAPWPSLDLGPVPPRRVIATGIGSSAAHARLLAHCCWTAGDLPARVVPLDAVPPGGRDDVLVVFSQGPSANARLALASAERWRRVILVTAATRAEALAPFTGVGARVVPMAGEDEFGTLVRVTGPLVGYAAALRLARALGADPVFDVDAAVAAVARAPAAVAGVDARLLEGPLVFVAAGGFAELATNLAYKVMEGLLRPLPPVLDLLHVAHGPFQQAFAGAATFVALTRDDAPEESALLARLERMLDPARHRLVRLHAPLSGPQAILAHEAQLDALLVRALDASDVDQIAWPGKGRDGPLYDLDARPLARRLDRLTWPEVAALTASGDATAIVPLGSIEQHGPHLPLATDAWIGDALAARLCAAIPEAVALPTLRLGCASEHLAFPGTLHLTPATLAAVLTDLLRALARHGFGRAFLFSAHGGNVAPLRELLPTLRQAGTPMRVDAFVDLDGLTAALHAVARAHAIDPAAGGHHAGEIETSILLALRAGDVRTAAIAPGLVTDTADPQALFYPDLRRHAPDGVVGDPRGANAERGARYLAAWVALLEAAYRGAKNSRNATGTQST